MTYSEIFQHLPIIGRFAIIFGLIVVLPKLAERLRLPGVIGLIGGGILLGPDLLGLVNPKGSSFQLFNELGKLLLMFFAGYEINLQEFRSVGKRAAGFGLLTFLVPMIVGFLIGFFMDFSMNAAILIGSLMASHTLLGFPVVKSLGLLKNDAVMVTVGATIFTDILSMLVLAVCLSIHITGFSSAHLAVSLIELAVYIPVVIFGFSWFARRLFAYVRSEELRLGILLLIIAVASLLAEAIELEGIVGAFLTGIAIKRAIGEESKSGHILEVVSHTLFIPVFLLGTGFLVNFKIFAETMINHSDAVVMVVGGLILAKFLAARIAGAWFRFDRTHSLLMWSLSVPQVAATLAATIVAHDSINAEGVRLLSETMLNTVVVMVIITSILGPLLTRRYGGRIVSQAAGVAPN